jgi:hypothetical protein
MCSVCGTNRKFTEKILKELQDCIEASKKGQARKDRLERTGSKGRVQLLAGRWIMILIAATVAIPF